MQKEKIMKNSKLIRILVLALALIMAFSLSSCGSKNNDADENKPDTSQENTAEPDTPGEAETGKTQDAEQETTPEEQTPAITDTENESEQDNAANTVPEEQTQPSEENASAQSSDDVASSPLSAGILSLDGEVLRLGTTYNKMSGGSWTLNEDNLEKYSGYVLNPMTTSGSGMTLYNDKYGRQAGDFSVVISTRNATKEAVPMLDGEINYISLPKIARAESKPEIMLPGGLTPDSTPEDFIAAYGEPTYEYKDDESDSLSYNFQDGEVKLNVNWLKGNITGIDFND